MKKRIFSLALVILLLAALTACGGSAKSASYDTASSAAYAPEMAEMEMAAPAEAPMPEPAAMAGGVSASDSDLKSAKPEEVTQDKIIYSAWATVETKNYEKAIEDVYQIISDYNGFLENSSIGGASYYGRGGRYAEFTIRIPSASFNDLTGNLSALGNVTNCRTNAQNVTTEYIDVQSRLESYRIQEERLLSMLEKAEKLEDMLTIESHLSEVRYNIENYTSQMNYLESQVSYSTVTISLEEVIEYTPDQSVTVSFGERMKDAFKGGISGLVTFIQDLILFLLYDWYVIVILALVIFVVVRIIKKKIRVKKEKAE